MHDTNAKPVIERKGIPEALLLAGASALSYAVAYAYRSGFASYFDLPPLLLTPTLGGILQAGAAVGALLLSLSIIVNGLWMFLPRRNSAMGRSVRRLFLMLLITVLMLFSLFAYRWGWTVVIGALCFFGFFELIFPLITQRKTSGYENKLLAQEKVETTFTSLLGEANKRFGSLFIAIIFTALILLSFAHSVGYKAAKEQEDYFVLTDTPGYIVAAMDDDVLVLAAYDQIAMTVRRAYIVRRLTPERAWPLEKRHIGRLVGPPPLKSSSP